MATSDRHYTCLSPHSLHLPAQPPASQYLHSWLYYFGSLKLTDCPGDEINLSFLIPPGRREDSEDAGSLPDRLTVTSTLRFRPRSGDNSEKIACEAQHPALTREPLRASVKMFVQCKLLMIAMIASVFIYLQHFFVFRSPRSS